MFPGPLLCFLRLVSSDNEAAARATVSQQPAHVCPSWLADLDDMSITSGRGNWELLIVASMNDTQSDKLKIEDV